MWGNRQVAPFFLILYHIVMEKFDSSDHKKSSTYLEQIDGNSHEKNGTIIQQILSGNLPRINGETRILEIGIGSGSGIEKIKNEVKDPKLVVYGMDMLEPIARRIHHPEQNSLAVVGDLSRLPFAERSISAINLSSVLHEGISYNQSILEGNLSIDDFIKQILSSLIKTLEVGGLLVYRDPGLLDHHNEFCEFKYSKTVSRFVHNFHKDFKDFYSKLIDGPQQNLKDGVSNVVLTATVHYQREVQRHLITYLDLALRKSINKSLKAAIKEFGRGDISWEELITAINNSSHDELTYYEWFKREGSEMYTYRSLSELVNLLNDVKEEQTIGFEIIEAYETERKEYSQLLGMVSDTTLKDTKQNLIIKRTK
jgi:SAM-dependent methyltransferase